VEAVRGRSGTQRNPYPAALAAPAVHRFGGGFLVLGVYGAARHSHSALGVCAGMFGVTAMAVQNALVPIALEGVPSTVVMTTKRTVDRNTLQGYISEDATKTPQPEVAHHRRWRALAKVSSSGIP
jgi:hypothetical protein